jgi:hypothetical protein
MLKKTFKTAIIGVIIAALALAFIGCDIENPNTPGTTTTPGVTTTPRITGTTNNTTGTPAITGTTTNNTTTGTGTPTTTGTKGRAGNMPGMRNGARNGADIGGRLLGSAPDLYPGGNLFDNGLNGNNGYPYGNPTGHFVNGYPNGTHGSDGYSEYAFGFNGYWNDGDFHATDGGYVEDNVRKYGSAVRRGRANAPGSLGFFGNTPNRNFDPNTVMNRIQENNRLCEIADDIKRDVKGMKEVRDAEVCVTDDSVFIGIKPGMYAGNLNNLKNIIQEKAKSKFPQAEYVHITDDNLNMQTIRRSYAKMKNSNIDATRLNEMLQVVRDEALLER